MDYNQHFKSLLICLYNAGCAFLSVMGLAGLLWLILA